MEVLSVRDYRNNLAASFDKAAEGERVLIRRKNTLYALVSIGSEDLELSPAQSNRVEELTAGIRRGLEQAKQMAAGTIPAKPALAFVDEL